MKRFKAFDMEALIAEGFTKEEILDVFLLHPIGAKFREKGMRSIPSGRTGAVRSQASINRYCCFLRTIFNFAVANGLMAQNPMWII